MGHMEHGESGEVYSITEVLRVEKNGLTVCDFETCLRWRMKECRQGRGSCGSRWLNGNDVAEIMRTGELKKLVRSGNDFVFYAFLNLKPV